MLPACPLFQLWNQFGHLQEIWSEYYATGGHSKLLTFTCTSCSSESVEQLMVPSMPVRPSVCVCRGFCRR
jgi:hypothetical protein